MEKWESYEGRLPRLISVKTRDIFEIEITESVRHLLEWIGRKP